MSTIRFGLVAMVGCAIAFGHQNDTIGVVLFIVGFALIVFGDRAS